MTFDYFIAYFLILFIATITPGPSMLLAINHGANHGIVKTINSGLGNLAGNLLMALVSILGLGALLVASGTAFNIIKWIGIVYLVFIGVKMIIGPVRTDLPDDKPVYHKKGHRLFVDGFFIAIGNPKGILFFTALFPQFINVERATIGDFLIVFITLGMVAFGCYMLYAISGVRLKRLFKLHYFQKLFNRVTGSILIGTGLALAFSKK